VGCTVDVGGILVVGAWCVLLEWLLYSSGLWGWLGLVGVVVGVWFSLGGVAVRGSLSDWFGLRSLRFVVNAL